MLSILGFIYLILGTQAYGKWFKDREYRNLFLLDTVLTVIFAPLSFIYIFRLNVAWGIPDMSLIVFDSTV